MIFLINISICPCISGYFFIQNILKSYLSIHGESFINFKTNIRKFISKMKTNKNISCV